MSLGYYHASLLTNTERLDAYQRAINEVVRPGDVVVDLGAGTGILSLLAARAGARRVYAIERSPIAVIAEKIVRGSPFEDRIEVIRCSVEEAELPELADVALTDTAEVDVLVAAARRRLLKVDARTIPLGFAYRMSAIELPPRMNHSLEIRQVAGFDVSVVAQFASQSLLYLGHDQLSTDRRISDEITLREWSSGEEEWVAKNVELRVTRPGQLGGLVLLRTINLSSSVSLGFRLGVPSCWDCPILPIAPPSEVLEGDGLSCLVFVSSVGVGAWRVLHRRGSQVLGSFGGSPHFGRAMLGERTHPHAVVPRCGRKLDFADSVLHAVDGQQSVADIISALAYKYPESWASEEAVLGLLKQAALL